MTDGPKKKRPPPAPPSPARRSPARLRDQPPPGPGEHALVAEGVIARSPAAQNRFLRWLAALHYATSQDGCTIAEMSRTPPFDQVDVSLLHTWSTRDGWVDRRRAFQDEVARKIRVRLGNEQVKAHVEMLGDLQGVYDKVFELLTGSDAPKPKSYEGLLRGYVKVAEAIGEIRRDVVDFVTPRPELTEGTPETSPDLAPELTDEEARQAAIAIVNMRRRKSDDFGEGEDEDEGGEEEA